MISEFCSIFLTLLLLLFLFRERNKKKERHKLPPGPKGLPIIGNLHRLGDSPHRSLQKLSNQYGPLMLLNLGSVPTLVISSSEMAKELFKNHDISISDRPVMYSTSKISYQCLDIVFSPYGDYWREIRKIAVSELFSMKRVHSFRNVREEEVGLVIDSISESSSIPVNLSEMMFHLANNVICRIAFSKKYESGKSRFHEILMETQELLGGFFMGDFIPWMGWIDKLKGVEARLEKNFQALDKVYNDVIMEHLDPKRPEPEHEDLVDVLLRVQKDQCEGIALTRDHIKAAFTDMFIAGTDTSSSLLVWTMSELIRNPIIMKKAQDEVRRVMGMKKKVEESDLPQLNYLKLVIKEALRMHPPSPLLVPRATTRNCIIKGYEIPAKTRVLINAFSIGIDPKCWKNAEEFLPERFIDSNIDFKGKDFQLLPFGAGRRACLGINYSVVLVELMLANLLHCFNWEFPCDVKDLDMMETSGITVHKKTPLWLLATVASLY